MVLRPDSTIAGVEPTDEPPRTPPVGPQRSLEGLESMTSSLQPDNRPSGRSPKRMALILAAVVAIAIVATVVFTGGSDGGVDADDGEPLPTRSVLDELYPDDTRPDPSDVPTPAPVDAAEVTESLTIIGVATAETTLGDFESIVLVENGAAQAFVNVAGTVRLLDDSGNAVGDAPFVLPVVEAGQIVAVTTPLVGGAAGVTDAVMDITARGTRPAGAAPEFDDIEWAQDGRGTVTVDGTVRTATVTEFLGVVAVLRDSDGTIAGSAFAFVDAATADGVPFQAIGFPAADIASVEVYAAA